ncbi:hypothetical protein F5Y10DRAFT_257255 [Nemania abortiva]|nr:hypothetical protein F5Y10DRAFT_257255 [Nemania abortiva]
MLSLVIISLTALLPCLISCTSLSADTPPGLYSRTLPRAPRFGFNSNIYDGWLDVLEADGSTHPTWRPQHAACHRF